MESVETHVAKAAAGGASEVRAERKAERRRCEGDAERAFPALLAQARCSRCASSALNSMQLESAWRAVSQRAPHGRHTRASVY
eukprot:6211790-Pleurochrysis_carterae.AAC.3